MAFTNLDPASFKNGFEADANAVVIDVRTPAELAEGSIDGHIMINVMDPAFPGKIAELDKTKSYYIYCRSGNRSGQVCNYMSGLGFDKLYNLQGGIMAWNYAF